jgi:hypothetical protein
MRSGLGSDRVLAVAESSLHCSKQRSPAQVSVFRYGPRTKYGVSVWRLAYAVRNPRERVFGQRKIEVFFGIEAMKDTGGVLTVKSRLADDCQIQISVNDTGPGLPTGKADQIFDAFFTTTPQGSGMGLAISKSIVESDDGRIWANGDGGPGTTFHFTLPAAPAETNTPVDPA